MALTPGVRHRSETALLLEFQELASLPCGCVAAAYLARSWGLAIVALEAKGPYCLEDDHASGEVLQLGDPEASGDEEEGSEYDG